MAELKIGISLPGEISETTDNKEGEEARHAAQPIPNSTGSFVNASQVGFWKKFDDDGQLNGGLYQSGDLGSRKKFRVRGDFSLNHRPHDGFNLVHFSQQ